MYISRDTVATLSDPWNTKQANVRLHYVLLATTALSCYIPCTRVSWYKTIYHVPVQYNIKWLKNGCPCIVEIRGMQGCALVGDPARVQGRSQGTTLNTADLNNARATILNRFYNMEYEIITKISQNSTWIEAGILDINLTPNRYNAHDPAIV